MGGLIDSCVDAPIPADLRYEQFMADHHSHMPRRAKTKSASDLITRYRADFGVGDQAIETAHAGAMWHIIALSHLMLGEMENLLRPSNLSPADLFVLAVLLIERGEHLRPSDVARILTITPAALSQRLGKLHTMGLLERREDGKDRRTVRLALTPRGEETTLALLRQVGGEARFSRALARLDSTQRNALEATLSALVREMDRHFGR
ncbi:MAG: MarR family transcriptional regulator [Novosphingobium sp.]|nr:MarR family transcriptional regulator [Novosphingobium sp.]